MEINQDYGQQPYERAGFEVDDNARLQLAEAGKWGKFLGIIGLIVLLLTILAGIGLVVLGRPYFSDISDTDLAGIPFGWNGLAAIYFIPALLSIYPCWALLKFGALARSAVKKGDQVKLNKSFAYLKQLFRFIGIITIIIILLYAVAIAGMAALM